MLFNSQPREVRAPGLSVHLRSLGDVARGSSCGAGRAQSVTGEGRQESQHRCCCCPGDFSHKAPQGSADRGEGFARNGGPSSLGCRTGEGGVKATLVSPLPSDSG